MQLEATLVQKMPLQTGTGKNGVWKKQEIIVETAGQFPKKVCISLWGDKADLPHELGTKLKIDFDVESREYNGRWYTDVRAWRIEAGGASGFSSGPSLDEAPLPSEPNFASPGDEESLPF